MISGPLVVTGTGTGVGKTVVTAALAALALAANRRVAVVKPAQTGVRPGEPGDVDAVRRLLGTTAEAGMSRDAEVACRDAEVACRDAGMACRDAGMACRDAGMACRDAGVTYRDAGVTYRELVRYPEPLAPATAARRAGTTPVAPSEVATAVRDLATAHDLVLVEGAGGLLVHFDSTGATLADVAACLGAPVLVVAAAGLGTLNHTALTVEALRTRGLSGAGVVIGAWPRCPDLAAHCNLIDLPVVTGCPLLGVLPDGAGTLTPSDFRSIARRGLAPELGGQWRGPSPVT